MHRLADSFLPPYVEESNPMNKLHRGWHLAGAFLLLAFVVWVGCTGELPELIFGPSLSGNQPPTLEIVTPASSFALNQGERLNIEWTDSDPDSAALISFTLVNVDTGLEIPIVTNIPENDSAAADNISVSTALVPLGAYNLRGDIRDGINAQVSVFALVSGTSNTRVVIQIGEPGTNPLSVPPQVAVIQPEFNLGVAQDDTLTVVVNPNRNLNDDTTPYDPDSDATLYILLDLDVNPRNDSPLIPDPNQIILLRQTDIDQGEGGEQVFNIPIDLAVVPPRADGSPYFVRATIVDVGNPAVHSYASGSIQIVRSATGVVDLSHVGTTLSGARFVGFNARSLLGSAMTGITDFDADGIDDFILVAKTGNPRNFGNIGEAYLIYGQPQIRFGGSNNVNSVSTTIDGVIIEGPPNRLQALHTDDALAKPQGITSVGYIPDLSGDGRPEILFGMAMVDGMYQGRDDDPGDSPGTQAIALTYTQDFQQRRINGVPDGTVDDDFQGYIDTYVDRLQPATRFDTLATIQFFADQPVDTTPPQQFALIAINTQLVLNLFTTTDADDIENLEATLTLRSAQNAFFDAEVFSVHQMRPGRAVQPTTTYDSFNADGQPGPTEDTDYDTEEIQTDVIFLTTGDGVEVNVDLTETIQAILDGEGGSLDFIFVPVEPIISPAIMVSSEGGGSRPVLNITYDQNLDIPNVGCYPDPYTNNVSTQPDDTANGLGVDSTLEASGAAFILDSENRDIEPAIEGATRMRTTVVALELIGQEDVGGGIGPQDVSGLVLADNFVGLDIAQIGGDIRQEAGEAGTGRTRGTRISAGWWEFVNNGDYGRARVRSDFFGDHVTFIPDLNNDFTPELMISSPRNEEYLASLNLLDFADATILASTTFTGSISIIRGFDYPGSEIFDDSEGNVTIPGRDVPDDGSCPDVSRDGPTRPSGGFEIFAENLGDFLGGAEYAGDVNLDGVPDIVCGARRNDLGGGLIDTGAVYIIYGRRPVGNVPLNLLDDPILRPPTLRIRGETSGDQLGHVQVSGLDINGDRIDDVFFASPSADFGGVSTPACRGLCGDVDGNGILDGNDLDLALFNTCRSSFGEEVFTDDQVGDRSCKALDFDNDRDIDNDDRTVFDCLVAGFSNCCPADNGFIGVIFGNINLDGDRTLSQLATNDLPGIKFFGANTGDRAGADVVSAGDFNRDGFGDLLIAAPGVCFTDANGRDRMGVAYLIFGGTHLDGNRTFSLNQVGSPELPGIVFQTPFFAGRPNEAPIDHVGALGDINADGFADIGLGITRADFIDSALPQNPNDPGTNPNIGRRPDDGNVYIIYGNNTGSNQ